MSIAKRIFLTLALILLGVSAWIFIDDSQLTSQAPAAIANEVRAANAPVSAATTAPSSVNSLDPFAQLANLDPFASLALRIDPLALKHHSNSVQALRELQRSKTLAEAQVEAAMSDDPVVHLNSFNMSLPCVWESVQRVKRSAKDYLWPITRDPKTGAPLDIDQVDIEFSELRAHGGPQRVHPPEALRAEANMQAQNFLALDQVPTLLPERDVRKDMADWRANLAPLSLGERASFDEMRAQLGEACDDDSINAAFGAAYRAQLEKLASQGVLSALLFNRRAGWTSTSLSALSERDFALVERGIREQQPDVIAYLLLRHKLRVDVESAVLPDDAIAASVAISVMASDLVACAFNVADCSPEGFIFQNACLMFGGCDQPDAFALWRHVLARDGLDPAALDRVVADLVAKIRAGDLDALGIRRKK
jgi:hypothetical protein